VKRLGNAQNGTAICLPFGSPATPLTLDDLQAYQDCAGRATAHCADIVIKFEAATGCDPDCQSAVHLWQMRTETFCAPILDGDQCIRSKAPCHPPEAVLSPAAPAAAGFAGAVTAVEAAAGGAPAPPLPRATNGNSSNSLPSETKGKSFNSSKAAAVAGGVAGGILVLLAAAALLVRRRRHKRAHPTSAESRWKAGSMPGVHSRRVLGDDATAPAERVKVTYLPGTGTLSVTQVSNCGRAPGAHSAASSISAASSPRDVLAAQLD
jgi:hypothetical protein